MGELVKTESKTQSDHLKLVDDEVKKWVGYDNM